jgi:hypothetical protein
MAWDNAKSIKRQLQRAKKKKGRDGGDATSTNDGMLEAPDGRRTCGLDGVDGSVVV